MAKVAINVTAKRCVRALGPIGPPKGIPAISTMLTVNTATKNAAIPEKRERR
jgi:hypothetical protein